MAPSPPLSPSALSQMQSAYLWDSLRNEKPGAVQVWGRESLCPPWLPRLWEQQVGVIVTQTPQSTCPEYLQLRKQHLVPIFLLEETPSFYIKSRRQDGGDGPAHGNGPAYGDGSTHGDCSAHGDAPPPPSR